MVRLVTWASGWCVRDGGIMDNEAAWSWVSLFGTRLREWTKARAPGPTDESLMTHAMVLTGVDLDKCREAHRAGAWKTAGARTAGKDGYFVMSDKWFDGVHLSGGGGREVPDRRRSCKPHTRPEPIVLEPWDPMGSLAL